MAISGLHHGHWRQASDTPSARQILLSSCDCDVHVFEYEVLVLFVPGQQGGRRSDGVSNVITRQADCEVRSVERLTYKSSLQKTISPGGFP